jgi:hypothetical protein
LRFSEILFPAEKLALAGDGDLSNPCPRGGEVLLGCFAGASVVAAEEFAIDRPSRLPQTFVNAGAKGTIRLHAMNSVVDWHAFAIWSDGKLQRSLSLSPDTGILEDIGARLPFEEEYWSGKHPAIENGADQEEYPLPFHPLDLAEASLKELFGFQLEGPVDAAQLDPESVPLLRFKRNRPWWKFWR